MKADVLDVAKTISSIMSVNDTVFIKFEVLQEWSGRKCKIKFMQKLCDHIRGILAKELLCIPVDEYIVFSTTKVDYKQQRTSDSMCGLEYETHIRECCQSNVAVGHYFVALGTLMARDNLTSKKVIDDCKVELIKNLVNTQHMFQSDAEALVQDVIVAVKVY